MILKLRLILFTMETYLGSSQIKLIVKIVDAFNELETRSWRFRSRYLQSAAILKKKLRYKCFFFKKFFRIPLLKMPSYDSFWTTTLHKLKFFIKDFFSKCDQMHSFLWIWSHLLKKSIMENFIFCAVPAPNFTFFETEARKAIKTGFELTGSRHHPHLGSACIHPEQSVACGHGLVETEYITKKQGTYVIEHFNW